MNNKTLVEALRRGHLIPLACHGSGRDTGVVGGGGGCGAVKFVQDYQLSRNEAV